MNPAITKRSALSDACRERLIRHNPAADASVPKEQRARVNRWNGSELGTFLDYVGRHPLGAIFELMAMSGLRRGEALGLRHEDVDVEQGFLVVRQQLVQRAVPEGQDAPCAACGRIHRNLAFGPPKTESGEARRVALSQAAVGVLLEHRLRQDAERAEWGDAYTDHGLVFADAGGDPWKPNHVTKTFIALAKAAGVRRIRLHDLRHGRASLMLAAGADMVIVSRELGHSRLKTTSDTYSHLLEGVGQRAADAADALIVRQPHDQSVTNRGGETVEVLSRRSPKCL